MLRKAIVAVAISLTPALSIAQSIVTTPILRSSSTSNTIVCRVANRTGGSIAPTIRVKSGATAGTLASGSPTIPDEGSAEVSVTNQSVQVYCEAEFLTNGAADQSRVSLILKDSADVALAAVRGVRVGSNQGSSVFTPSLTSDDGTSTIACYALNTDSVQRDVTLKLFDDAGDELASSAVTLSSGTSSGVASDSPSSCQVIADSGTIAGKLRVSITELVTGTGSTSALEGY